MNIFTLMGTILVDNAAANNSISATGQAADGLAGRLSTGIGKVGDFCSKAGAEISKVGTSLSAKVTAPIAALGAGIVKVSSDFESGMSQVAATMGITTDEIHNGSESFIKLQEAAKQAGATTQFSASESAEALNYLALAGYDAEQACEALPKVLNLAAAGGLELGYASDLVTDSMSALGLEMNQLDTFMDQMAKTAQKSNTSVGQLGEATLVVGGTAKTLSGGITEMNTALGILADNGIKGSEGGTALRNVILSLTAPTDKAAGALEDLGVQIEDAEGNMRPLEDIMTDLSGSMDGLGTVAKADILNTIFNKVDLKSVSALMAATTLNIDGLSETLGAMGVQFEDHSGLINQIATDYNTLDDKTQATQWIMEEMGVTMEQAGTIFDEIISGCGEAGNRFDELSGYIEGADGACADMAETMLDNFGGQVTILKSSLEGLGIQLGEIIMPYFKNLVSYVQDAVTWFSNLGTGTQTTIVAFAAVAAAIGPVLLIGGKLISGIGTLCTVVSTVIGWFTVGASGVSAFGAAMAVITGPIGITVAAIAGLIAILVALYNNNEEVRAAIDQCWSAIKECFNAACEFIKGIINAFITAFTAIWTKYGTDIQEIIKAAWDAIAQTFKIVIDLITDIFNVFSKAFQGDWKGCWEAVKDLAANLWNNITGALGKWLDLLVKTIVNIGHMMLDAGKGIFTKLKEGCTNAWNTLMTWLKNVINNPVKTITGIGSAMMSAGKSIFNSLWDGIKNVWSGIQSWVSEKVSWIKDKVQFWKSSNDSMDKSSVNGSHAGGINYVPFDGYLAELHKGERVLTASENNGYEGSGATGTNQTINIVMNYPQVSNKQDIKSISRQLKEQLTNGDRALGLV